MSNITCYKQKEATLADKIMISRIESAFGKKLLERVRSHSLE